MPRKLDNDTRMHFRTFDDETHAQKRAFCLHCNKDACADNIQRMKNHLIKCDVYLSSTANTNQVATNAAAAAAAAAAAGNGAGAPPQGLNESVFSVQMEDAPMGAVLGNSNGLHPMTTTHPQLVPRPQQQDSNQQQQQQQQQQSPAKGSTTVAPNGRTIAPSLGNNPSASQQPTSMPPTPTSSAPSNVLVSIVPAPPGSAPGPGTTAGLHQQAQQPQSPTPNIKTAQTSLDKVRQAMSRSTKRLDSLEAVLKTQVQDGMHNAATHVRAAMRDERDRLFKLSQTLVKQEMRMREVQNPLSSF